jgi:hypothetical protein
MSSSQQKSSRPPPTAEEPRDPSGSGSGDAAEQSDRRLKEKLEKLKKEDPNIYPIF